ncbi:antibiotic biosynthesis monooxygenase family protein [Pseudonocardia benzenivorans]|uniref:Antibiotic biosynthesis monooxygenase n=2 Tax=Pseudonocardia TaxID=1847 RepID=F4CS32_PSEUX|nr:antibiotic biosynthesis monooxygenase family protein [Pseudonocardia dioxanivorans]AEA28476.1 Antibiotic biosynthesis monooxygenase [Pseudonocardia dioxanivorans CB1190]GJF03373.1 antibiotic biosynthesis monooxygenase [Pseudonocardia sp. D17]
MVVEHAYITVVPGCESDFEEAFAKAQPILSGAKGCRASALHHDVEHPGAYLLRVTWERLEDHLEVFPASEVGKEFGTRIAHFFVEAPEVRHFADESVTA